jgi:hypothetical protein
LGIIIPGAGGKESSPKPGIEMPGHSMKAESPVDGTPKELAKVSSFLQQLPDNSMQASLSFPVKLDNLRVAHEPGGNVIAGNAFRQVEMQANDLVFAFLVQFL